MKFSSGVDHSKWAVSVNTTLLCIGDINREVSIYTYKRLKMKYLACKIDNRKLYYHNSLTCQYHIKTSTLLNRYITVSFWWFFNHSSIQISFSLINIPFVFIYSKIWHMLKYFDQPNIRLSFILLMLNNSNDNNWRWLIKCIAIKSTKGSSIHTKEGSNGNLLHTFPLINEDYN